MEMHQISMLPEPKTSSKQCSCCKEIKPLEDFNLDSKSKTGYQAFCRVCSNKKSKQFFQDYPEKVLLSNMIIRTRKRGWDDVEWTEDEVRDKLNSFCEVTGIPFETSRGTREKNLAHPFVGSPDRIDNTKGYTKENTRWVVWIFNAMCSTFSDEQIKEFIEHLRNNEINL